ncbi:MAG: hypothetical protein V4655_05210 [Bdellovibrionota bacterium]|nr:MAG: hypothetical protein EOP10_13705 [Pseudomonadota bacterium]
MALHLILLLANQALGVVPTENVKKPAIETIAVYDGKALVEQLNKPTVEDEWNRLFFPADAFDQVKGIKDPGAYHKQLLKWFAADVQREHERLKAGGPWAVDSFKLGSCKWKEKGTEANALPYWSCYKSKLNLKNEKGEKSLVEIRALINWGTQWYITHLGPIPKS